MRARRSLKLSIRYRQRWGMRTYAIKPTRLNRGEKGAWTVEWIGPHHGRVIGHSVVVSKHEDEGEESWECTGRWSYGCRREKCEHLEFVREYIAQTSEQVGGSTKGAS